MGLLGGEEKLELMHITLIYIYIVLCNDSQLAARMQTGLLIILTQYIWLCDRILASFPGRPHLQYWITYSMKITEEEGLGDFVTW